MNTTSAWLFLDDNASLWLSVTISKYYATLTWCPKSGIFGRGSLYSSLSFAQPIHQERKDRAEDR